MRHLSKNKKRNLITVLITRSCIALVLMKQSCIAFPKSLKQYSTKKILPSHSDMDTMPHFHIGVHAEIRSRYDKYWNDNWGGALKDSNGYLLHRLLLSTDIKFSNKFIMRAEVKSALHSDLDIPLRPVDEDKLDFLYPGILDPSSSNISGFKIGQ